MYIIMGGTGHVGSAVADTLLSAGEAVTIVTRNPTKAAAWETAGARVVIADVYDVESLREVFRSGRRAFLLNPPAAEGLNQAQLGQAIGVTFQQVQKYERGVNRVSASTLHRIASHLECQIGDLFPNPVAPPNAFGSDPVIRQTAQAMTALTDDHR